MSTPKRRAFIPRKRQERGARRAEAMVAAAAALFAERGFEGTSLNAIAKAAGVTIASIYQYFPNREAIIDAVAEYYLAAFRAEERGSQELSRDLTLREFMHIGVTTLFDFHSKYGGLKAFLDADPRRAPSIRTIHEEVANIAPLIGRYYPHLPYEELARAVFVLSALIRGSASALPTAEALGKRAEFIDDVALAAEHYVRARLGPPVEATTAESTVQGAVISSA
jgi:AcrR family transcriptional regulator